MGAPPQMPPPQMLGQQQNPGASPQAQLAQAQPKQGGDRGSLLQMLMAFLAGAGTRPVLDTMQKFMGLAGRGSMGGNQARPHQAQGQSIQGSAQPGVHATPSAQGQQGPPGGQPGQQPGGQQMNPQLLQMLLAKLSGGQQQ